MINLKFKTPRESLMFELGLSQGESRGFARAMEIWGQESMRKLEEVSAADPPLPQPLDMSTLTLKGKP